MLYAIIICYWHNVLHESVTIILRAFTQYLTSHLTAKILLFCTILGFELFCRKLPPDRNVRQPPDSQAAARSYFSCILCEMLENIFVFLFFQFQFVNSFLSLFYLAFYIQDMERLRNVIKKNYIRIAGKIL